MPEVIMKKVDILRQETYEEAMALLKKYKKCAIIRPTGFGKTGILTKIIKGGKYKKILYLYPADVVRQAVFNFYYGKKYKLTKNSSIPNVTFMTYMKLTSLSDTDMKDLKGIDLIICDECHRLGATETMEGMKDLIESNPKVSLLGATATPERMDMIDEIALFFDDRVTSRYTLHDAFQDGIIKKPYYCFCAFGESDPQRLAEIKKDAMLQVEKLDELDRKYATELLKGRMIEISKLSRMDYVIASTLQETKTDTSYQKYIVFCSGYSHLRKVKTDVKKWFKTAFPKHTVNELVITAETSEYEQNVTKLATLVHRDNTIDLIFSCEMLNMGYHVDDLTGILMYRSTYSGIVYAQQLGRALSTGDAAPKIVFDIVDNIHRKSVYAMLGENCHATSYITEEEKAEYIELVNRIHDKDKKGNTIKLNKEEQARFIELSKLFKLAKDLKLGKTGCNTLTPEDLIVTKYAATYKELIAKTVAESVSMLCRQAWNRWIEKGGDTSIMTREYILSQQAPEAVPLSPFCKLKNVSINAVLTEMGVA